MILLSYIVALKEGLTHVVARILRLETTERERCRKEARVRRARQPSFELARRPPAKHETPAELPPGGLGLFGNP
jgi:hypothetical protein